MDLDYTMSLPEPIIAPQAQPKATVFMDSRFLTDLDRANLAKSTEAAKPEAVRIYGATRLSDTTQTAIGKTVAGATVRRDDVVAASAAAPTPAACAEVAAKAAEALPIEQRSLTAAQITDSNTTSAQLKTRGQYLQKQYEDLSRQITATNPNDGHSIVPAAEREARLAKMAELEATKRQVGIEKDGIREELIARGYKGGFGDKLSALASRLHITFPW